MNSNIFFEEMIYFGLILTIFGFLVSYFTDFIYNRKINWLPEHSFGMATGTFFTGITVFYLFSEKYINYKCNKNNIII